jgi:sec-independent protein translocase protein TatA
MMTMGMIGTQEILLIFVAIVLLFGASRLPDLARSMGRSMGEFRRGQQDIQRELSLANSPAIDTDVALTRVQRMANSMGISIEDKSEEQLLAEIEKKLDKK